MVIADNCTLLEFTSSFKSTRFERRVQQGGRFGNSRSCGCDYYMYIEIDTLQPINPYSKKDKGKKYKSFFSSSSADHAKELAYNYIKETMKGYE